MHQRQIFLYNDVAMIKKRTNEERKAFTEGYTAGYNSSMQAIERYMEDHLIVSRAGLLLLSQPNEKGIELAKESI